MIRMFFVAVALAACGITPLKPLVPLGCKDLVWQCVCDEHGQNCKGSWICQK